VRKGFEDYELLRLLEKAVRRPKRRRAAAARQAKELLRSIKTTIAPDPARHTQDDRFLQHSRRQIGETIAELAPNQ
jgi:hypothetical protein